jgi:hypothetical protein
MPARRRAIETGSARGRAAVAKLGQEFADAIRSQGLSYAAVARDVGLSGVQVGRVARGLAPGLTIIQASELLASVGLELSIRAYPTGQPLRDRGHLELLERLRGRLHRTLMWKPEVPVTGPPDLRAWDAVIDGQRWRIPVEAETRLGDLQAVERRIALKLRDGRLERVILLVSDTRHNRIALRSVAGSLDALFPVPGRRVLELLAAGVDPGGSSIVVL